MLPFKDLSLVPDATRIDRIAQDVMNVAPIERIATRDAPARALSAARLQAKVFGLPVHLPDGAMFLMREASQQLAQNGGAVVNVASVCGLLGSVGTAGYSAAKAGIIGATRALSKELAKRKITVNSVAPGLIETDMVANLPLDEMIRFIPMRRLGRPEEVAAPWPCDDRDRPGESSVFRAIDIDAPPTTVFRWLCQLKEAPYSYDWLDNRGRKSPRQLTPGTDQLAVDQRVMEIFKLVEFETDRFITLITRRDSSLMGSVLVTYQTLPRLISDSVSRSAQEEKPTEPRQGTRLIARLRILYPSGFIGSLAQIGLPFGDWIMMRKQFLTLKALAEADTEKESGAKRALPGSAWRLEAPTP